MVSELGGCSEGIGEAGRAGGVLGECVTKGAGGLPGQVVENVFFGTDLRAFCCVLKEGGEGKTRGEGEEPGGWFRSVCRKRQRKDLFEGNASLTDELRGVGKVEVEAS